MKKFLFFLFFLVIISCNNKTHFQRTEISLNGEWNLAIDSLDRGTKEEWYLKGLPEDLIIKVKVPNTFNTIKGLEKYNGVAWYEKIIKLPASFEDKLLNIKFGAVYHTSAIFINGKKVTEHNGSGYNTFNAEATGILKQGENRIIVRVDNSFSKTNIPYMNIFDWAHDGGIIRDVTLIATNKTAIQSIDIKPTLSLKDSSGIISITVPLTIPEVIKPGQLVLHAQIQEDNQPTNKIIWENDLPIVNNEVVKAEIKFNKVNLWHFDTPNLYKIILTLSKNGNREDLLSATFGFRTISVDEGHFYLNGEPVRLAGIEWMPGSTLEKGMAETHEDLAANLKFMKGVNCIYTRFHWQQDEYLLDWADHNGLLIQEEIPLWGWVPVSAYPDTILKLEKTQLFEMITAHNKHPSIISWGVGNELKSQNDTVNRVIRECINYTRSLDSSRLVVFVSNQAGWGKKDASIYGDVIPFNEYYSTWYGKSLDIIPSELDRIHSDYPGKGIIISEFGICEPAHKGGDIRRCREMKEQIKIYGEKSYIPGIIYFSLNDYRTHMGEDKTYSYPQRVHGIMDIKRNPKPSFDTLKTLYSPVVIKNARTQGNKFRITLQVKDKLPSYSIKGYVAQYGDQRQAIPLLNPGDSATVEFKKTAGKQIFCILRPTGFEVLRKEF